MAKSGGQPGNNNAGIGRTIRDAINYELAAIGREIDGDEPAIKKGMRAIVQPIIQQATEGNISAFKEIADRVDGKPAQALDLSGEVGVPLSGTVKFVKSDKPDD